MSAEKFIVAFVFLGLSLHGTTELAHAWQSPDTTKPAVPQSAAATRAFPRVAVGGGLQLKYLGSISPDGRFAFPKGFRRFFESRNKPEPVWTRVGPDDSKMQGEIRVENEADIRKQVPPSVELHRHEQTVEDYQPPEHAVQAAKGRSVLGEFADSVTSAVYGAEPILISLESVTSDSQQRVLVTDAGAHAVHVLSRNAKQSFQIVGGPGRRLQSPKGVAVDGDDNIYVSDPARRVILVYDSEGQFLRTIGSYGDEGLFEHPSAIAIDRKAARLYVTDPPRHTLFILDLKGFLLARIETKEAGPGSTEPGGFQYPQAVLVHNDELAVLDGARILLLTLQGTFVKEFKVANRSDWRAAPPPGLFMDAENHIYLSDPGSGTVREYDHDGRPLGAFGRPGVGMGEFSGLAGMWADSAGRVYIADAHRVQIFQLSGAK